MPTLAALQSMSKTNDIPFSEFLASPNDNSCTVDIGPPAYTQINNFQYDLSCLLSLRKPMQFTASKDFDIKALIDGSTLDDKQADALINALSHRFAICQGPPGTGKSYTALQLIRVLVQLGTVLIVTYSNHALDQNMESCLDIGVEEVIRIGSRSKSERLQDLNLRAVAREMGRTGPEKNEQYAPSNVLDSETHHVDAAIQDLIIGGLLLIRAWLDGKLGSFAGNRNFTAERLLNEEVGLREMIRADRNRLHTFWLLESRKSQKDVFRDTVNTYKDAKKALDAANEEVDLRCLQKAKIIGITTSGLARNIDLLKRLPIKVVLVEEAGEILEAHTLTAMLPSVEHAILIGDHLQLKPSVIIYELSSEIHGGKKYSLNMSLFERLVNPPPPPPPKGMAGIKLPFTTLEIQRRMHPCISDLIRQTLYPRLQDAPNVSRYPEVVGLRKRLFWLDHNVLEDGGDQDELASMSKSNSFEAEMVACLVAHLLSQGEYGPQDIAVLTPYLDQLLKLQAKISSQYEIILDDNDADALQKLDSGLRVGQPGKKGAEVPKKKSLLQSLKAATVDNFQGEEAKVVIISLVRCNKNLQCGFLRTPNCINVLLSRAKYGMYIISNSKTCGGVPMWGEVIDLLKKNENIGKHFALHCPRHPGTTMDVSTPDDFQLLSPEGGCKMHLIRGMKMFSAWNYAHVQSLAVNMLAGSFVVKNAIKLKNIGVLRRAAVNVPVGIFVNTLALDARHCSRMITIVRVGNDVEKSSQIVATVVKNDVIWVHLANLAKCLAKHPAANRVFLAHMRTVHRIALTASGPSLCGEACPSDKFCQICAPELAKTMVVDYTEFTTYQENNLDRYPIIVSSCGHIVRMVDLDSFLQMDTAYDIKPDGTIKQIKASEPFSSQELKSLPECIECRGSLRRLNRYGRLVRRVLLDESTKRFVTTAGAQYGPLVERLFEAQQELVRTEARLINAILPPTLHLAGNRDQNVQAVQRIMEGCIRYNKMNATRLAISQYLTKVHRDGAPFARIRELVEIALQNAGQNIPRNSENPVAQVAFHIMALALMIRCDMSILADTLKEIGKFHNNTFCAKMKVNFRTCRSECEELVHDAMKAKDYERAVEGHVFFARYCAMKLSFNPDLKTVRTVKSESTLHIEAAYDLCKMHGGKIRTLISEVRDVERSIKGATFLQSIISQERCSVIMAMSKELGRGIGQWYTCANGHPFSVGEYGLAMQVARCPQCGAPIGGLDHQLTQGAGRVEDINKELVALDLENQ
ncbi:hypothetical protein B0J11DRAFT_601729 [Dendryphion nanum]|uniref:RZ-type domain-containing protein n=1 Tax=Dendryphion nanum TaxID=256645 RepID=A0A9P9I6X9_9PLEO|nr:hypothetical protein B0J11DRAFT_601729 [Dendryphion nanum]